MARYDDLHAAALSAKKNIEEELIKLEEDFNAGKIDELTYENRKDLRETTKKFYNTLLLLRTPPKVKRPYCDQRIY